MSKVWLLLEKDDGGELLVPESEVGAVSTVFLNRGTEEEPNWVAEPTKSLVHIKCLNANIIVNRDVQSIKRLMS